MHVLGSCEASAQYSPINFFVNLFHSKNSNLPHCFSDLIHTEYRKLHKNNGHLPFVSPSIMRSSVGQCRNIRFRQLSASHVIITSDISCCLLLGGHYRLKEVIKSSIHYISARRDWRRATLCKCQTVSQNIEATTGQGKVRGSRENS